jgi:hypothetical protein
LIRHPIARRTGGDRCPENDRVIAACDNVRDTLPFGDVTVDGYQQVRVSGEILPRGGRQARAVEQGDRAPAGRRRY